jgi:amino acid adenylation domain-containing protein
MVPGCIVELEQIPLSANGKVDRGALPAPQLVNAALPVRTAPTNAVEAALCEMWQEVLGIAHVGIHDNFFDCGGDSLRAVTLLTKAKQRGIRFSVRDLYTQQTISRLCAVAQIDETTATAPSPMHAFDLLDDAEREVLRSLVDAAAISDAYPLSKLQQGMIFHSLLEPDRGTYHEVLSSRLQARWDEARFTAALVELSARHEILRAVFRHDLSPPLQLVLREFVPLLEVQNLQYLDAHAQKSGVRDFIDSERRRPFDWARPAWKVVIHLCTPHEFQYTLVCHHALLDGWSVAQFNTQLFARYTALLDGATPCHAEPAMPYRHFIAAEIHAATSATAKHYWINRLADAPLPWWAGARKGQTLRRSIDLDGAAFEQLQNLAKSLGVQEKSVFLAAHMALLSLLSGQLDVVTSVVTHCRPEVEGAERALGLFLNSLPFRIDLRTSSWQRLIEAVERSALDDDEFKLYPLANIQADTGLDFAASLFTYVNFHAYAELGDTIHAVGDDSVEVTNYLFASEVAKNEMSRQWRVTLIVEDSVFDARRLEGVADFYRHIFAALLRDCTAHIDHQQLLGRAEVRRLLTEWNDTACTFADACIHELFERQVAKTPDATALIFEDRSLTYAELNRRANQLAHYLRSQGVDSGDLIGLCAERSLEMVIGIYGILKAGAAYVPLDPTYPEARLRHVVSDAAFRLIVTQRHLADALPFADIHCICLDDAATAQKLLAHAHHDVPVATRGLRPDHAAYVIYTSGSTGMPKGVVVPHRGLVNRICWMDATYRLTSSDVVLQKTPYSFDVSVWEFTWPLIAGASLVIAKPEGHKDPQYLSELINARRVTTLHFVPSMLRVLLEHTAWQQCASVRQVFCSGEALPRDLEAAFFATGTKSALHNLYGPTEASIDVSHWTCSADSGLATVPIGKPIQNTQLYVLNAELQLLPCGVPGELHIGGVGLALGYLNQPALTAERFVRDPFSADAQARLYKTGDLARHLPDGSIEFLGRIDHQVKVRGFRIELGEIEGNLMQHEGVRDAVVTVSGERLIAYVAADCATEQRAQLLDALRTRLRSALPDYMLPSGFVMLERMPLNANGKVDRKALPKPDLLDAAAEFEPPRDAIETTLCAIWQDLLGVTRVGIREKFFEIGGDSLKLVRLGAEINKRLGIQLPVMQLYQTPSVADIAHLLRGEGGAGDAAIVHELTDGGTPYRVAVVGVPYAAGDGVVYRALAEQVGAGIGVFSITNPRTLDPGAAIDVQLELLLGRCVDEIRSKVAAPIVVWGHCLGYALALQLARRLLDSGVTVEALCLGGVVIEDDHLQLSHALGAGGAQQPSREQVIQMLTRAGLTDAHGDISAAEWELIVDKFQQDLLLSMWCDHRYFDGSRPAKLPLPVYCVVSSDDPLTEDYAQKARNWHLVSDHIELIEIAGGGHYFVNTRRHEVAALLRRMWGEWRGADRASAADAMAESLVED